MNEWRPQKGKQELALTYNVFEELYGGARGGGKTAAGIAWLSTDIKHPKYRALVIRKNADDLKDWVDKARALYIPMGATVTMQSPEFRFPWGAVIRTGHLADDKAYEKYQGQEFCRILIEELTQIPTEERYLKLISSCRSAIPELKARIFATTNPGGPGHAWVKKRFVDVIEPTKVYKDPITGRGRVFIPATVSDNPILLEADPNYVAFLNGLPEALKKMWRDGNWDVFAGQFFTEWDVTKHVIKPFTIPLSWFRYRSIDISGHTGITSCHWYAVNNDGRVYAYKEYYIDGKDYDEHAREIYKMSLDEDGVEENYRYTVIDSSAFAKAGFSETPAEIYNRYGVNGLIPSAKGRVEGLTLIHQYLRWDEKLSPLLQIFSTCYNMIKEIPLAQHDEKNPEDILTNYTGSSHNDAIAELMYFLRTLREVKAPKPLSPVERKLQQNMQHEQSQDYSYARKTY